MVDVVAVVVVVVVVVGGRVPLCASHQRHTNVHVVFILMIGSREACFHWYDGMAMPEAINPEMTVQPVNAIGQEHFPPNAT